MTEKGITRLASERDSAGNIVEFFRYENARNPRFPKYFSRRAKAFNSTSLPVLRHLLARCKNSAFQEGFINTQPGGLSNITFEFDHQSIEDPRFAALLTSPRLVYVLFRLIECAKILNDNCVFFRELPTKAIKLFMAGDSGADVRFENPFFSNEFFANFEASIIPKLQQLNAAGLSLDQVIEARATGSFASFSEPLRGLMVQLDNELTAHSKRNLFMLFFHLFCLKIGKPPTYYSQNEATFLANIGRDIALLNVSTDLRELFRLVLLQKQFSKVPSFSAFVNKFIRCIQPCEGEFDRSLQVVVQNLAAARRGSLEVTLAPVPNSEGFYEFLDSAVERSDEHEFTFGPSRPGLAQAPTSGGGFFDGVSLAGAGPGVADDPSGSNFFAEVVQRKGPITNIFPNSGGQSANSNFFAPTYTGRTQPTYDAGAGRAPRTSVLEGFRAINEYPSDVIVSEENQYGLRIRRLSPSPVSTPRGSSLATDNGRPRPLRTGSLTNIATATQTFLPSATPQNTYGFDSSRDGRGFFDNLPQRNSITERYRNGPPTVETRYTPTTSPYAYQSSPSAYQAPKVQTYSLTSIPAPSPSYTPASTPSYSPYAAPSYTPTQYSYSNTPSYTAAPPAPVLSQTYATHSTPTQRYSLSHNTTVTSPNAYNLPLAQNYNTTPAVQHYSQPSSQFASLQTWLSSNTPTVINAAPAPSQRYGAPADQNAFASPLTQEFTFETRPQEVWDRRAYSPTSGARPPRKSSLKKAGRPSPNKKSVSFDPNF